MSPTFDLSTAGIGLSDELDGDPDSLDRTAGVFIKNSEKISDAATNLKRAMNGEAGIESKAFGKLFAKSKDISGKLHSASLRYRRMGSAVKSFSKVLREEQGKVSNLVSQIGSAQLRVESASHQAEAARTLGRSPEVSDQKTAIESHRDAQTKYNAAVSDLHSNRAKLKAAANRVNEHNIIAAQKVQSAAEDSGLDDTTLDKVKNTFKKIAKAIKDVAVWVWEHLDEILTVLEGVSLILTVLGVTAPIAGAIFAVTRAVRGLVAIKKVVDKFQTGMEIVGDVRDGNWSGALSKTVKLGVDVAAKALLKKGSKKLGSAISDKLIGMTSDGHLLPLDKVNLAMDKLTGSSSLTSDGAMRIFTSNQIEDYVVDGVKDVSKFAYKKLLKPHIENAVDHAVPNTMIYLGQGAQAVGEGITTFGENLASAGKSGLPTSTGGGGW